MSPATNSLSAIDSIGITYLKNSNKICFLLHDSFDIEKIEIGHQHFAFSRVEGNNKKLNEDFSKDDFTDVALYEINLPSNLSPNSIKIYYTGYIGKDGDGEIMAFDNKLLLTDKRISLKSDSCWYPTIPQNKFKFNLSTLSPATLTLCCVGEHSSHKSEDDLIFNNWIQNEPVDGIDIYSIGS